MAITYASYDTSKPNGGTLAQAVDYLRRGRDLLNRAYAAANAATDAGSDTTKLVDGDFGATDNTNAQRMWDQMSTIKTLLDGDDAGGLSAAVGSLDKGLSG